MVPQFARVMFMQDEGVTWIVAADGAEAKVFEERLKAGAVHELPDWRMSQSGTRLPRLPFSVSRRRPGIDESNPINNDIYKGLKESVGPVDFRDNRPLPDFSRAAKGRGA